MPTLSLTVNATNPDAYDRKVMDWAIDTYNTKNGTSLTHVDATTRKASYETVLAALLANEHASYLRIYGALADSDAKTQLIKILAKDANNAQKDAAITALGG